MQIKFSPESLLQLTSAVRQVGASGQQGQQNQQTPLTPGQQSLTQATNLPPLPQAGTQGIQFQAMVIASDAKGQMTLSLQNGITVNVQSNSPLPVGTQVMLSMKPNGDVQVADLLLPAADAKASLISKLLVRWEGLDKAITRLQETNPAAAQTVLKPLPSLARGLLPGFVQFMNAVKSAQLEDLFNKDAIEALRSVGVEGQMRQDVQQMHALHQKSQEDSGWRSFIFPYVEDQQDHNPKQGSFYWRSEKDDDGNGSHRFVLNMALSELGALQLDGLVKGNSLFLKVRTLQELTPDVVQGLQDVVTSTLEKLEWTGATRVEHTNTFTVDPLGDMTQTRSTFDVKV